MKHMKKKTSRWIAWFLTVAIVLGVVSDYGPAKVVASSIAEFTVTIPDGIQMNQDAEVTLTEVSSPAVTTTVTVSSQKAVFENFVDDAKQYYMTITGFEGYEDWSDMLTLSSGQTEYQVDEFVLTTKKFTVNMQVIGNGGTISCTDKGICEIADSGSMEVAYGETPTIQITQKSGCHLQSLQVGDMTISASALEESTTDNKYTYTMQEVKEDVTVSAVFANNDNSKENKLLNDDEYTITLGGINDVLREYEDGNCKVYVVKPNTMISISPKEPYTKVQLNNEERVSNISKTLDNTQSELQIDNITVSKGIQGYIEPKTINKNIKIIADVQKPMIGIQAVNKDHNGYYTGNVNVQVAVTDTAVYSGIESVTYKVTCNGSDTQSKTTLYSCSGSAIESQLTELPITVDALLNNSDDVMVYVTAVDKAGNENTAELPLKINITKPVINVSITETEASETGIYGVDRTATITVTDRNRCFLPNEVDWKVNATNVSGDSIMVEPVIQWISDEKAGDVHTGIVVFDKSANYNSWEITYENLAGLTNEPVQVTGAYVNAFTIDKVIPEANISFEGNDGIISKWDKLLSKITFGLWKKDQITIYVDAQDVISGIEEIAFYKAYSSENNPVILSSGELEELYRTNPTVFEKQENLPIRTNGKAEASYVIDKEEQAVIYVRIEDKAGNVNYICTDGLGIDHQKSDIIMTPDNANANGIYNAEVVNVQIVVNDIVSDTAVINGNEIYSGINYVETWIECDGVSYEKNKESLADTKEAAYISNIAVNSDKYNSSDVKVWVKTVDNAGNVAESYVVLDINRTRPTIAVSFNNNDVKEVGNRGYFGKERVATIEITAREGHFNKEKAVSGIVIKATDNQGNPIELDIPSMLSNWTEMKAANSKNCIYKLDITFDKDANYDFNITYTDDADNKNEPVVYKDGTRTPEHFTVDTVKPEAKAVLSATLGKKEDWIDVLDSEKNGITKDTKAEDIIFGRWTSGQIQITAAAVDITSPTKIEYYKTDDAHRMTYEQLDGFKFQSFDTFTIIEEEQVVIYLKITDYAGNYVYIGSNGYIIDKTASAVTLIPDTPNANNIYNKDVNVKVIVTDSAVYSGISDVKYWIEADTMVTREETVLYDFDQINPTQAQLVSVQNNLVVPVIAKDNNSSNVVVHVQTTDNAGNIYETTQKLDIDITAPTIQVIYDNNDCKKQADGVGYFAAKRTATVTITERTNHFDGDAATKGIVIEAMNNKETSMDIAGLVTISNWTTTDNTENPDGATHTATINYYEDARYQFAISYTDKADNACSMVDYGTSVATNRFVVDTTAPTGQILASAKEENGWSNQWKGLLNNLTFKLWSRLGIVISGNGEDVTSPIETLQYYETTVSKAMSRADLDKLDLAQWKPFNGFTITPNKQRVIYLKITDFAGNVTYINTDGLIVDDVAPMEEKIAPKITMTPQQPINDIYSSNVDVEIKVAEPIVGETYSGLQKVWYEVLNNGTVTQSGDLYVFNTQNPTREDLIKDWSGSITVDAQKNNSNNVTIRIYAMDNAGNLSNRENYIMIDITKPVINISYDNNTPDSGEFYGQNRVATIDIIERNFKEEDIIVAITNTDGVIPTVTNFGQVNYGSGNGDDTIHRATVTYEVDGDYTFDIAYTDKAGNVCEEKNYSGTNTTAFTIDKTKPVVMVTYDNNSVKNDKYFKASRTATIEITEHNFDVSRVELAIGAKLDGTDFTIPKESWKDEGDIHTATVAFAKDGDYTFDVTMLDKAGNESDAANYKDSVAAKEFTVDTKIEKPEVLGVVSGGAYKDDINFSIKFDDVNFDLKEIKLTRTRKNEIDIDVTDKFIKNMEANPKGGIILDNIIEKKQENDGIYTLYLKIADKAGNEMHETVVFSVNRFGSVYTFNDYLVSLQDAYIQAVDEEIVITEYNPDPLVEGSTKVLITCDGTPVTTTLGENYTVEPVVNEYQEVCVGESGWYQYNYTIDSANFSKDGIYTLAVTSKDKPGEDGTSNLSETTNYEECDIQFSVDTTPAEITSITGLEEKIVDAENKEVNFEVFDAIGLKEIKVYVDEEEMAVFDKFEDKINFSNSFIIEEGASQKVRIVVEDLAGNVTDTDSDDFKPGYTFYDTITVSTSWFVRWFANKPLFWGSIAAIVVAAGGVTAFIIQVKKKKGQKAETGK